jgi:DNA polymerase-4
MFYNKSRTKGKARGGDGVDRDILHVDMNGFYASVEMQRHPELRDKPLAICGSQEEHHGIVLTANYIAKPYGVKTGMA